MTNAADGDDEIFEIHDYTCVSPWEQLCGRFETLITEWSLHTVSEAHELPKTADELGAGGWQWSRRQAPVTFSSLNFTFTYFALDRVQQPRVSLESVVESPKARAVAEAVKHLPVGLLDSTAPALDTYSSCGTADSDSTVLPDSIKLWYGCSRFVLVQPDTATDVLYAEPQWTAVNSALQMALLNTECAVPGFVQQHDVRRQHLTGACCNAAVRASMHSAHLKAKTVVRRINCLSHVVDLFREKVNSPIRSVDSSAVKVTVRLTYTAEQFGQHEADWMQQQQLHSATEMADPDHPDSGWSSRFGYSDQLLAHFRQRTILLGADLLALLSDGDREHRLPFGVFQHPVSRLRLHCTWPNMNEEMLVENEGYSDLQVSSAPYWHLQVDLQPGLDCLMHSHLQTFVRAHCCVQPAISVTTDHDQVLLDASLGRLTEQSPVADAAQRGVEGLLKGATSSSQHGAHDQLVNRCIDMIFADTPAEQAMDDWSPRKRHPSQMDWIEQIKAALCETKSARMHGVTVRTAVALCAVLNGPGGLAALMALWHAVLVQLRQHWHQLLDLPGLASVTAPDHAACAFEQDLQVLQCCIRAKRLRLQPTSAAGGAAATGDADDDEDEFMDALDEVEDPDDPEPEPEGETSGEPVGRSHALPDHTLLLAPATPLFVPLTQEPAPMTERMLDAQMGLIDRFSAGGTANAASELHSATLLSDMQAFKAANPGACLADFVRWHSPRDWVDEPLLPDQGQGEVNGHLSARMSDETNLWHQTWHAAKPVPVGRQVRLFNESNEAEKILYSLSRLTVGELVLQLLPALFTASFEQLLTEVNDVQDLIGQKLLESVVKLRQVTRNPHADADDYRDVLNSVHWLELSTGQYRTLHSLFDQLLRASRRSTSPEHASSKPGPTPKSDDTDVCGFVRSLLRCPDAVPVLGAGSSRLGAALLPLFVDAQADAVGNKPTCKQYTLRWLTPSPSVHSRPCPQRLYVRIDEREFRMHGLFTQDATFM